MRHLKSAGLITMDAELGLLRGDPAFALLACGSACEMPFLYWGAGTVLARALVIVPGSALSLRCETSMIVQPNDEDLHSPYMHIILRLNLSIYLDNQI